MVKVLDNLHPLYMYIYLLRDLYTNNMVSEDIYSVPMLLNR